MNSFVQGELDFESGDVKLTETQYEQIVEFFEKILVDNYAEPYHQEAFEIRDMLIINKQICSLGTEDPENRDFDESD